MAPLRLLRRPRRDRPLLLLRPRRDFRLDDAESRPDVAGVIAEPKRDQGDQHHHSDRLRQSRPRRLHLSLAHRGRQQITAPVSAQDWRHSGVFDGFCVRGWGDGTWLVIQYRLTCLRFTLGRVSLRPWVYTTAGH